MKKKLTLHPSRSWPVGHKSLPLLCSTCSKPPRQTVCSYIRRYKFLIWKTVNLSTKKASSWMALRDQLATCLPPATNLGWIEGRTWLQVSVTLVSPDISTYKTEKLVICYYNQPTNHLQDILHCHLQCPTYM